MEKRLSITVQKKIFSWDLIILAYFLDSYLSLWKFYRAKVIFFAVHRMYVCFYAKQYQKKKKKYRVTHKFDIFSFDFAQRVLRIGKTNTPTKILVILGFFCIARV